MHCIMLDTRMSLVIFGICRPLHSLYYSYSHTGSQIRVFAESLLSPPPTRITENIHIRIPKSKPFVSISIAITAMGIVEFSTSFITNGNIHSFNCFIIKGRCHTHSYRKHCSQSITGNTMQSLTPPIIGSYS